MKVFLTKTNMKIEKFEDIKSWKMAREVINQVYDISDRGEFMTDYAFKNQIRKSCISISSNISEGFERGGNREFANFLSIAKGSAGEARAQLYVALDRGYVTNVEFEDIYSKLTQIGKLLSGFMNYLKKTNLKGSKFK